MASRGTFGDPDLLYIVAGQLKQLRVQTSTSQQALNNKLRVSSKVVSRCETGSHRIQCSHVIIMCLAMQIDPAKFIERLYLNGSEDVPLSAVIMSQEEELAVIDALLCLPFKSLCKRINLALGKKLKEVRNDAALSLRAVSAILSKPHSLFGKLECAQRTIDVAELALLVALYKGSCLEMVQDVVTQLKTLDVKALSRGK